MLTLKINPDGNLIRQIIYDPPNNTSAHGRSLCIDLQDNLYVTGWSGEQQIGFFEHDYITLKYDSAGNQLWKQLYNGVANTLDISHSISIDTQNNVYITGESAVTPTATDIVTIKYSQTTGIQTLSGELPQIFSLEQNYPNPFNPSTNINFEIANTSHVKLVIYDALGREVSILADESMKPGSYNANFTADALNSGIYFYSLITDSYKETKKMILLK